MTNEQAVTSHVLEMRELKADDLFKMMPIIGGLNIKDDIVNMFQGNMTDGTEDEQTAGLKIMATILQTIMTNIGDVKHELNSLLGDLTGKTEKEVEDLDFATYTNLIVDFFKKPELGDFFKSIASFMG